MTETALTVKEILARRKLEREAASQSLGLAILAPTPASSPDFSEQQKKELSASGEYIPASSSRLRSNLPANFIPNEMQKKAISFGLSKPAISFCLTGPAGCGKSTTTAAIIEGLNSSPLLETTKYLQAGTPGVAIVSFTRQAVKNIRKMSPDYLKTNCLTIHALLEFTRDVIAFWDPVALEMRNKMIFVPQRTANRKLPKSLHTVIIDESSTVGTILHELLTDALHSSTNIIYVGDIQQLTPPFDDSIFGFKLQQLPVVELSEVFRQAEASKILMLAHRILSGKPIATKELRDEWKEHPDLKIKIWGEKVTWEKAVKAAGANLIMSFKAGTYDPNEDMVLCPFNKKFGTLELNRLILQGCFPQRKIHHVISGIATWYLAVDDLVMFKKEDYKIIEINRNASYSGVQPLSGDYRIDRWGNGVAETEESPSDLAISKSKASKAADAEELTDEEFEFNLEALTTGEDERLTQSSHVLHLQSLEFPFAPPVILSAAGDVNSLLFAHAQTVHKSQGSQWDRVFFLLHHSHNTMLCRELLYTGVTRAAKELIIYCEPGTFVSGITSQRIPGKTAAEKAEFFKGKVSPAMRLKAEKAAREAIANRNENEDEGVIEW